MMPYGFIGLVVLILIAADIVFAFVFFDRSIVMHREEIVNDPMPGDKGIPLAWTAHLLEIKRNAAWMREQRYERVFMTSRDELRLAGYWLPAENEKRVVMFFHGYKSNPWWDSSGMGQYLHEHGCSLFLADQRAHGESEGEYITFGVKERLDCADWAKLVCEKYAHGLPVYLFGVSMGATTVMLAASEPLPENVLGIAADCGFTSAYDEFAHILGDNMHIPPWAVLPLVDLICRKKAGFRLRECYTVDAIRHTDLVILLIHGGSDDYVPTEMSRDNFDFCYGRKHLLIVDGAPHALSYYFDPKGYRNAVVDLFNEAESIKTGGKR